MEIAVEGKIIFSGVIGPGAGLFTLRLRVMVLFGYWLAFGFVANLIYELYGSVAKQG